MRGRGGRSDVRYVAVDAVVIRVVGLFNLLAIIFRVLIVVRGRGGRVMRGGGEMS